jgi:hypothetical protein
MQLDRFHCLLDEHPVVACRMDATRMPKLYGMSSAAEEAEADALDLETNRDPMCATIFGTFQLAKEAVRGTPADGGDDNSRSCKWMKTNLEID